MLQYLFYNCTDKYERRPLQLAKQVCVSDLGHNQATADDHDAYFQSCLKSGEYSALHIMVLRLDPANGITEVVRNEYAENPLKQRIVINAPAKVQKKVKTAEWNTVMFDDFTQPQVESE